MTELSLSSVPDTTVHTRMHVGNRVTDTESKQNTGNDKNATEDKQEQADDGSKSTQVKRHGSEERVEHRQREPKEAHQASGKRKERER